MKMYRSALTVSVKRRCEREDEYEQKREQKKDQ